MAIEIVSSLIKNGDFPYKSPFFLCFFMVFPSFFSVYQRVFSISMGILQALEALESWKIIDSPGKTSPRVHVESRQQQGLVPRGSPFLMNGRSLCCSLW